MMLVFFTSIFYIGLAIIFGLFIILLPPIWKIRQIEIVVWPLYSAWGIGWVITGLWALFSWDWRQWLILTIVFHSCFPIILVSAQENHNLKRLKDFIACILKGYRNESRV
jgi:hypothetical protein